MRTNTNAAEESQPSEAPPAYTSVASASCANPSATSALRDDDRFAFLCDFDTIFLIDDAASMRNDVSPTTGPRAGTKSPTCSAR